MQEKVRLSKTVGHVKKKKEQQVATFWFMKKTWKNNKDKLEALYKKWMDKIRTPTAN